MRINDDNYYFYCEDEYDGDENHDNDRHHMLKMMDDMAYAHDKWLMNIINCTYEIDNDTVTTVMTIAASNTMQCSNLCCPGFARFCPDPGGLTQTSREVELWASPLKKSVKCVTETMAICVFICCPTAGIRSSAQLPASWVSPRYRWPWRHWFCHKYVMVRC